MQVVQIRRRKDDAMARHTIPIINGKGSIELVN